MIKLKHEKSSINWCSVKKKKKDDDQLKKWTHKNESVNNENFDEIINSTLGRHDKSVEGLEIKQQKKLLKN